MTLSSTYDEIQVDEWSDELGIKLLKDTVEDHQTRLRASYLSRCTKERREPTIDGYREWIKSPKRWR